MKKTLVAENCAKKSEKQNSIKKKKISILENLISYNTINDLENEKLNDYVTIFLINKGFKVQKVFNDKKASTVLLQIAKIILI